MPNALEALREVLAEWLTLEETTLSEWAGEPSDAILTARRHLWVERLRAYERIERALASPNSSTLAGARASALPESVERGLFLVA